MVVPAGFGLGVNVKHTKLAQPITTDEGDKLTEQVREVAWSGGQDRTGSLSKDFPVSLQMPDKPGTALTFKAVQTYDNGDVTRWIGPPDAEEPAPQVKVIAAEGDTASTSGLVEFSDSGGGDDDSKTLAIIALIVGGLGLIAGGAALLTRRRAA